MNDRNGPYRVIVTRGTLPELVYEHTTRHSAARRQYAQQRLHGMCKAYADGNDFVVLADEYYNRRQS